VAFASGTRKKSRSLIASAAAVDLSMPIWSQYPSVDSAWQQELWRLYHCVPEFAKGANYVGSCCSRCRIYVAEVDDRGEVQQEVKSTNPVGKLAYTVLGGPEKQPELQNLAGTASMVSGEFWTMALEVEDSDRWFVVQYNELIRMENFFQYPGADPIRQFAYQFGDKRYELREGRDILFRTWSPDPSEYVCAYSPARSLATTLVELEILSQYILAQARSRLASGGVWPLPKELDFPAQDNQPPGVEGLMQRLLDAATRNLQNFGNASQLIPLMVEAPAEVIDKIKEPIIFGSVLSEQASALRQECRQTIANGLDIAPEIITGMGDANHWNGPAIEQSTIDSVIVPIMTRLCNSLTTNYLVPAVKLMGKEPKKYKFWFDTASLVTRPNKLKETLELYSQKVVGIDEVLKAADLPESAKMGDAEREQLLAAQLLLSDGNMVQIKELREKAGLKIKSTAPDSIPPGQPGGPPGIAGRPPAPPPPARTLTNLNPGQQPGRSTLPGAPNNAVTGPGNNAPRPAVTASLASPHQIALLSIADAQVRQALDKVGKSLRSKPGGAQFKSTPPDQVYLNVHVANPEHARALLASCFGHLGPMLRDQEIPANADEVRSALMDYCVDIITHQWAHEVRIMRGRMELEQLL
jgi:hypothetical protein